MAIAWAARRVKAAKAAKAAPAVESNLPILARTGSPAGHLVGFAIWRK